MKNKTMLIRCTPKNKEIVVKKTFNMYGSTFCIHRKIINEKTSNKFWAVSEYRSGCYIPISEKSPDTIKLAIELAKKFLNKVGKKRYNEVIKSYKYGFLNGRIKHKQKPGGSK